MRVPSLDNLLDGARSSLTRFPFVLVVAAAAAVAAIVLVQDVADETPWVKLLLCAQLGIPLLFSIAVAGEARGWPRPVPLIGSLLAAAALVAYGLHLPSDFTQVDVTRHIQFTVGLHLLAAFAPFAGSGRLNGFWQYNRSLFLRFCLSVLYSVVLYAGLVIALLAVDKLLGVDVPERLYVHLWTVIAFVFNTWMFVGGVPRDIVALDDVTDYPKGLKVFSQHVLVPLVFIYLVILTVYLGKVIVTREWPSGWIGYLVSSVAVVGILAHLLVHPIRGETGNQWVRSYSRWYYVFMIPAVVMLMLAVGKRIDQYGVTENRYLLAVLSGWLAFVSVYFIFNRSRNIKLIPVTLCVVAFGTSFGPWGAFAFSQRSQLSRLTGLLDRNGILIGGTIRPASGEVPLEDRKEIGAVLDYLVSTHGTAGIEPMFGKEWAALDSLPVPGGPGAARRGGSDLVRAMMDRMGIEYVPRWHQPGTGSGYFSLALDPEAQVFPVADADVMVRVSASMAKLEIDGPARTIVWDPAAQGFTLIVDGDTLAIDVRSWASSILDSGIGAPVPGNLPVERARIDGRGATVAATLFVESANGQSNESEPADVHYVDGMCFLRWIE